MGFYVERYHPELIASDDKRNRILAIRGGYGFKELCNDKDWEVRLEVAKQGYNPEMFVEDKAWPIRKLIAERGYGHEKLMYDEVYEVKLAVAKHSKNVDVLTTLIDDENWLIGETALESLEHLVSNDISLVTVIEDAKARSKNFIENAKIKSLETVEFRDFNFDR
jgi:hypothetical protein